MAFAAVSRPFALECIASLGRGRCSLVRSFPSPMQRSLLDYFGKAKKSEPTGSGHEASPVPHVGAKRTAAAAALEASSPSSSAPASPAASAASPAASPSKSSTSNGDGNRFGSPVTKRQRVDESPRSPSPTKARAAAAARASPSKPSPAKASSSSPLSKLSSGRTARRRIVADQQRDDDDGIVLDDEDVDAGPVADDGDDDGDFEPGIARPRWLAGIAAPQLIRHPTPPGDADDGDDDGDDDFDDSMVAEEDDDDTIDDDDDDDDDDDAARGRRGRGRGHARSRTQASPSKPPQRSSSTSPVRARSSMSIEWRAGADAYRGWFSLCYTHTVALAIEKQQRLVAAQHHHAAGQEAREGLQVQGEERRALPVAARHSRRRAPTAGRRRLRPVDLVRAACGVLQDDGLRAAVLGRQEQALRHGGLLQEGQVLRALRGRRWYALGTLSRAKA